MTYQADKIILDKIVVDDNNQEKKSRLDQDKPAADL